MNVTEISLSMQIGHMLSLEEGDVVSTTFNRVLIYNTEHALWILMLFNCNGI
jgi:hypothetical protein